MLFNKIRLSFSIIKSITKYPKVKISFRNYNDKTESDFKETYRYFIKPHRLKIIKNKTIGVALINLGLYEDFDAYYQSVNGKNSAAYYSRKANKREYHFREINRNLYVDDIYDINTSAEYRQGKKMSDDYLTKTDSFIDKSNYRYFGILNNDNKLVAYCNIGFYGEFALVATLLGHKDHLNNGVMYYMMMELNQIMLTVYRNKGYKYIMYDTLLGASSGLKKFKEKLGYKPYKVKWEWAN